MIKSFNWRPSLFLAMFMIPLFSIGMPYRDDFVRMKDNYFRWSWDGRPLADVIMHIASFGDNINNLSPYSYVLVMLICSVTCHLICRYVLQKTSWAASIASSLIFVSPFYTQNLLYHFDSIIMSSAILFAVTPFVFIKEGKKSLLNASIALLFCLMALSTYQAAISAFFACALLRYIGSMNSGKSEHWVIPSLTGAALSIPIYKFTIYSHFAKGEYQSAIGAGSLDGLLETIGNNFGWLFSFLGKFASSEWIYSLCMPFIFVVFWSFRSILTGRRLKESVHVAILFGALLVSFAMLFITKAAPMQARAMIGVTCIIFCVCGIISITKVSNYIATALLIAPLLYCFSFSQAVTAAAKSQWQYENSVLNDIKSKVSVPPGGKLYLSGDSAETPVYKKITGERESIKYIVNKNIGNWYTYAYCYVQMNGMSVYKFNGKLNVGEIDKQLSSGLGWESFTDGKDVYVRFVK
ncbi:glucosyltransferase domain-containing protein [Cronobacter dublinensis]